MGYTFHGLNHMTSRGLSPSVVGLGVTSLKAVSLVLFTWRNCFSIVTILPCANCEHCILLREYSLLAHFYLSSNLWLSSSPHWSKTAERTVVLGNRKHICLCACKGMVHLHVYVQRPEDSMGMFPLSFSVIPLRQGLSEHVSLFRLGESRYQSSFCLPFISLELWV